ncbi:hypothetical protein [Chitinolyticbacter meiyuanensis]|uniref:hypothetical protein n=1 Tax=Chitinolyticbacter meiyuanensis TaxID=682798 RepID=UPI001651DBC6|nr:hypothetical protein [Chitinolyticbacter meiyuanensis]
MKIKLTLPKPRNPVALAARQRHAGVHDRGHKAKRQQDRQALQRKLQRDTEW